MYRKPAQAAARGLEHPALQVRANLAHVARDRAFCHLSSVTTSAMVAVTAQSRAVTTAPRLLAALSLLLSVDVSGGRGRNVSGVHRAREPSRQCAAREPARVVHSRHE